MVVVLKKKGLILHHSLVFVFYLIFYGLSRGRDLFSFVLSCDPLVCFLLRNLLIIASSRNRHIREENEGKQYELQ